MGILQKKIEQSGQCEDPWGRFGGRAGESPMDGIVLIDKPRGPTSFEVVRRIRKAAAVKRVGHTGTLDPNASGLMVVCLGRYTKLASFLTDGPKIYEARVHLGVATTTDDDEGEVIEEKCIKAIVLSDIALALKSFLGPIMQIPPRFSAVKIQGKRAYVRARADEDFSISARPVEIFSLDILNFNPPMLDLRIHCSKGTYVRSLARDLGKALGVCAHAQDIRRLASSGFPVENAISFDAIKPDVLSLRLQQGISAFGDHHVMAINEHERNELRFGRNPFAKRKPFFSSWVLALCDREAVAVLRNEAGVINIGRVL
jgi:tRNA pseudouridine55 synthase